MAETTGADYYRGITKRAIRTAVGVSSTALCRLGALIMLFAGLFAAAHFHPGLFCSHGLHFHAHRHGYQL